MNTISTGRYPATPDQQVLSLMLYCPPHGRYVAMMVNPEDFHDKVDRIIFSTLHAGYFRDLPPDSGAVTDAILSHDIGWDRERVASYLEILKLAIPPLERLDECVRTMKQRTEQRRQDEIEAAFRRPVHEPETSGQTRQFGPGKLYLVEDPKPNDGALQFCDWKDLLPHYGDIEWVWKDWLPRGMVSILAAETGIGKTACAMGLAGVLTAPGEEWPDGLPGPEQPERVVFIETENRTHLLLQRLWGWGLEGFELVRQLPRADRGGIDIAAPAQQQAIAKAVKRTGARLLIIDSLSAGHRLDENSKQMKRLLLDLCRLAQEANVALLAIHHLRKRRGNESTSTNLDRLRGSTTIAQLAVVTLTLERPDPGSRTLALRQIKNNVAPEQPPVGMQITQDGVVWTEAPEGAEDKGSALERARDFVLGALEDGPVESIVLYERGAKHNLSRSTVYRAVKSLGLDRSQYGWVALQEDAMQLDSEMPE